MRQKAQSILIGSLAFGYIFLQVFPFPQAQNLISILIMLFIVWMLPTLRGASLFIISALVLSSVTVMGIWRVPFQDWLDGVRINLSIIALFYFVPLLGIPIRTGNYVQALQKVSERKIDNPYFYFLGSKCLTHILGVVLNFGAVSIVYQLSKASRVRAPRLLSNAMNRGYGCDIIWSPYFASTAIVLSLLALSWSSIVGYCLAFTLICFMISFLADWRILRQVQQERRQHHEEAEPTISRNEMKAAMQKVIELFGVLFAILAIVLVIEMATAYNIIFIISIISILFPLVWCLSTRKWAEYAAEIREYTFVVIPRMKKEFTLFLVAGFFSMALSHADVGAFLMEQLNSTFGSFIIGKAFCIALFIVIFVAVGLHPLIIVTILATNIDPHLIGLSREYFAVLLLGSWGISNTVSPSSGVINLLAYQLQVKVTEVTYRWNAVYLPVSVIVLPVYLTFIGL